MENNLALSGRQYDGKTAGKVYVEDAMNMSRAYNAPYSSLGAQFFFECELKRLALEVAD